MRRLILTLLFMLMSVSSAVARDNYFASPQVGVTIPAPIQLEMTEYLLEYYQNLYDLHSRDDSVDLSTMMENNMAIERALLTLAFFTQEKNRLTDGSTEKLNNQLEEIWKTLYEEKHVEVLTGETEKKTFAKYRYHLKNNKPSYNAVLDILTSSIKPPQPPQAALSDLAKSYALLGKLNRLVDELKYRKQYDQYKEQMDKALQEANATLRKEQALLSPRYAGVKLSAYMHEAFLLNLLSYHDAAYEYYTEDQTLAPEERKKLAKQELLNGLKLFEDLLVIAGEDEHYKEKQALFFSRLEKLTGETKSQITAQLTNVKVNVYAELEILYSLARHEHLAEHEALHAFEYAIAYQVSLGGDYTKQLKEVQDQLKDYHSKQK